MIHASGFRPGDVTTEIGTLRLTIGGLAEMAQTLDAPDPVALATRIRVLNPDMARHLLIALLRPSGANGVVVCLSDTQIAGLMPAASRCIGQALS